MQRSKVLLADDHPVFLEGLSAVLDRLAPDKVEVVGSTQSGSELLRLARTRKPRIVILELSLMDRDGLDVIGRLGKLSTPIQVIVLSRYDDPKLVRAAFKAGADGYLLKDNKPTELLDALTALAKGRNFVGQGVRISGKSVNGHRQPAQAGLKFEDRFIKKFHLTKRELEVLQLISQALSNKEIARDLYISDQTVSVHRKNIMRKLGVCNTAGLIKAAYEHSLL